ncbi:hypothetical protein [Ureaplasma urealyticum]|uniref:Replicative helicase loading/DNA remodeling protein DnaB N-terminal winged helix domain-containing protein n=3 Tax=Ureaplasma urealyticum TaxID=2130 RepID=A0AAP9D7F5_UREUR|nr:hypothetical protein [Ureaplasma urealyticum]EDX53926.1 conserved hypothetical protein [Ureaplasma urealyticum serovar 9 str. ATCC 33175]ACI60061.1 conserved hypothetical protein [Ureaplasma urealyticum serovar 10 str. ATCC 33699]EDT49283.1 conserved hypothetical protein [Ureaplasma urealyticum serovar 13 str. ATCC 33698]EDU05952.1 conserved hypothetical protein [Ureaplasma urealyticum serovar 5 str. ATCC 27817]EDU56816.1 conserved hypothetical protein [Ureaplasma urealyticum serovar 7 str.
MDIVIKKNCNFIKNENYLYSFYTPLIGIQATAMYSWFVNRENIFNKKGIINLTREYLLNELNISINTYNNLITKLVNVDLIKIYCIENNQQQIIEVFRPLNFNEFSNIEKFNEELKNNVSNDHYKILNLLNKENSINNNRLIDLSTQFKTNYSNSFENKLDKIKKIILDEYQLSLQINESVKLSILNFFKKYKFSVNEMANLIKNNLINNIDFLTIDLNKLELSIISNQQVENNKTKLQYQNIERDSSIFNENADLNLFKNVINHYNYFEPSDFLKHIRKEKLSVEDKEAIILLTYDKTLNNAIVNVILDFVLFKNLGRLNIKYLKCIKETVLGINIKNEYEMIKFFQNKKMNQKQLVFNNDDNTNTFKNTDFVEVKFGDL